MILVTDNSKDTAREIARKFNMRLSFDALSSLTALLQPRKYRHRTAILKAGETATSISFVAKGLIRQYKPSTELDIVEDICHENNLLICMESMLTQMPSRLEVQTLEPTIIYSMDYLSLKKLAAQLPEINTLLNHILEDCILKQIERHRLADLNPRERYLRLMQIDSEVVRRTPLKYVASYLRMAPATLSRIRTAIQNHDN